MNVLTLILDLFVSLISSITELDFIIYLLISVLVIFMSTFVIRKVMKRG